MRPRKLRTLTHPWDWFCVACGGWRSLRSANIVFYIVFTQMHWRSDDLCMRLVGASRYGSGARRARAAVRIAVNDQPITSGPEFESWYDAIEVEEGGSIVKKRSETRAKFLFIFHVLTRGPLGESYTATADENGDKWGSTLRYTVDGELYYNGARMTVRDRTPLAFSAQPMPSTSVAGPSGAGSSTQTANQLGDDRIVFRGCEFELVMPAGTFSFRGMRVVVESIYICRRCQIVPEQAWPIPTLLLTARTWEQVGPACPSMTHPGAFGDEYTAGAGTFGAHRMVLCWKFPGDMFAWGSWNLARIDFPLPVGRYPMTDDKWGSVQVGSRPEMPIGQPMIKMRAGGVHYLQARQGGDDTQVAMLGFQYFVSDMWAADHEGVGRTGSMLDRLYNEVGIVGFANHDWHHAIVMYAYDGFVLSPRRWQALLQGPHFGKIEAIFLSGAGDPSGIQRCLHAWRTANLTQPPFLP